MRRPSSPADGGALEREARELALGRGAEAGLAVGFDVFPFTFGPTPLSSLLPQEQRAGSRAEMAALLQRLADGPSAAGTRVAAVLESGIGAEMYVASDGGPDRHVGRTLAEVADGLGVSVTEAAYTLLADAGENFYDVVVVERWTNDDDLDRAVADPAFALDGRRRHRRARRPAGDSRVLAGRLGLGRAHARPLRARHGQLRLEDAIRRMTQAPARQLGLENRGVLAAGMAADVAVFDLDGVGTSVAPNHLIARPRGVPHVFVGGAAVVRDGEPTSARPGAIGR